MSEACSIGFAELFRLARGRAWTADEERSFAALDQPARNALVRTLAAQTRGRIITEDRIGTDGVIYTAFTRAADAIEYVGPRLGCGAVCEEILRDLPEWFGIEAAIVQYVKDVDRMETFLARDRLDADDAPPIGFLSVHIHYPPSAEMHVLGVRRAHHRRGVGRGLVETAERWLRARGVEYLQVKTLGPSRDCAHYAATRAFYEALGFRPLEEFPTLWDARNPCLIMVKKL